MSKNYSELRDKMSPEARDRAAQRTAVMMGNPIEAGARAICDVEHGKGEYDNLPEQFREQWREPARAAAIAMVGALSDEACLDLSDTDRPMSFSPERFRAELIKQLTGE